MTFRNGWALTGFAFCLGSALIGCNQSGGGAGTGTSTPSTVGTTQRSAEEEERVATDCQKNVKQLGTGFLLYSSDNNDRMPLAADWMGSLEPYTKNQSLFHCPALTDAAQFGYAYNSVLSGVEVMSVENISQTAVVYDSDNLSRNASDAQTSLPKNSRHNGVNAVGYLDGSARKVPAGG